MCKSFISVWSAKFSSRRVAASPLPSESRVANETQQLFCSYDFTYRINQSNSPNRFFTDENKKKTYNNIACSSASQKMYTNHSKDRFDLKIKQGLCLTDKHKK